MANIIEVQDLSDPALDVYARLTEPQLRNRREPEMGIFIAESLKVIRVALDAGCAPRSLLMTKRHLRGQGREIVDRCADVPVYTAEEAVLEELTGYPVNRGMLCAMARPAPVAPETVCAGARRVAVLEGIADATNVGAIFRSAAALGMDGVLLTPNCCDPLNRRAVRVSMGTVLQLPWAYVDGWPREGLERLRALGFETLALALADESLSVDEPALARAERLALVLGAEGDGLAPRTIAACDRTVRIPMKNGVDSLNVAAAGAVAFWQLRVRER